MDRSLYSTLGLEEGASIEFVRKFYRSLALKWHPDRNPEPTASERMQKINEAHQVLGDPTAKEIYDALLKRPPSPALSLFDFFEDNSVIDFENSFSTETFLSSPMSSQNSFSTEWCRKRCLDLPGVYL